MIDSQPLNSLDPPPRNPETLEEIFALRSQLQSKEIEMEDLVQKQDHLVFDYEGRIRELQLELEAYRNPDDPIMSQLDPIPLNRFASNVNKEGEEKPYLEEIATKIAEEIKTIARENLDLKNELMRQSVKFERKSSFMKNLEEKEKCWEYQY